MENTNREQVSIENPRYIVGEVLGLQSSTSYEDALKVTREKSNVSELALASSVAMFTNTNVIMTEGVSLNECGEALKDYLDTNVVYSLTNFDEEPDGLDELIGFLQEDRRGVEDYDYKDDTYKAVEEFISNKYSRHMFAMIDKNFSHYLGDMISARLALASMFIEINSILESNDCSNHYDIEVLANTYQAVNIINEIMKNIPSDPLLDYNMTFKHFMFGHENGIEALISDMDNKTNTGIKTNFTNEDYDYLIENRILYKLDKLTLGILDCLGYEVVVDENLDKINLKSYVLVDEKIVVYFDEEEVSSIIENSSKEIRYRYVDGYNTYIEEILNSVTLDDAICTNIGNYIKDYVANLEREIDTRNIIMGIMDGYGDKFSILITLFNMYSKEYLNLATKQLTALDLRLDKRVEIPECKIDSCNIDFNSELASKAMDKAYTHTEIFDKIELDEVDIMNSVRCANIRVCGENGDSADIGNLLFTTNLVQRFIIIHNRLSEERENLRRKLKRGTK